MGQDGTVEDQRQDRRLKVFQLATLVGSAGAVRIHLLDISQTGALAHAQAPPRLGEQVRLQCGDVGAAATVRWRSGKRFGIAFAAPVSMERLQALTRACTPPRPNDAAATALAPPPGKTAEKKHEDEKNAASHASGAWPRKR